ncbi:RNA polymerase sigma factor [Alkalihalobacillus sp. AL-G]|uniref:RNA polymerase sigma factor n=1 Tax=Alkalihalobacillus sp. AL-G TaxID=2926399 RepID=UPI00272C7794|nr:sigma-70 family RNA polymerase sigma factor [Alkalihalobacillus sp. AL-G]WLD94670.1 sigma-70 family RNA polymerase sigma factor [Alkalihalobacillus sp. AL-G]
MNQELKWIKSIKKHSSESSANQLVHKYYKEIFAFVYKQTLDQELAKDITQEIFISMLRTVHSFDGRASFRTWLYKVANSRLIDFYRSKFYRQQKQTEEIQEESLYEPDDFTVDVETKEHAELVLKELARFDQELQHIVRLKIYGQYTFAEIAASTEITESTVKTKYYATIRKLQQRLKEDENE